MNYHRTLFQLLLTCTLLCLANSSGLVDNPLVGNKTIYLDGEWNLSNGKHNIPARVPGDIISDLYQASLVKDPMYSTNWLEESDVWASSAWDYSTKFELGREFSLASEVYLTFDGIKMGATISLNGRVLGIANDQFLRFTFPVKKHLNTHGPNLLTVSFGANFGRDIDCQGRFMACTGGWDWAPYSNTFDAHGAHTLSFGIWKSVYVTAVSSVAITHIVPHTFWKGPYPTKPLTSSDPLAFDVKVTVHFLAPVSTKGKLVVAGSWGTSASADIIVPSGESSFVLQLSASQVNLWWPNGLGEQVLYDIDVSFYDYKVHKELVDQRKIGFRVVALVTDDDSEPRKLEDKDGSGSFTMRFKVNGANVWIRGGNMIPMESFEGRANEEAYARLVDSAAEGNFNMLRIWGGGIFFYDVFYDECDKKGILLYHDMMYAQMGHSPNATQVQTEEIKHNVRRLSHHPSIIVWDGCNECGGLGVYNDFVVTTVMQEDKSRPLWPSCPSCGYESGVDRLYGLPNGKPLVTRPPCSSTQSEIETHGPYEHGTGFKTADDPLGKLILFPADLPPPLKADTKTGPQLPGMFASEFGCVGMSSFESMSPTLESKDWSLHSEPMAQRNYPCDNIIQVYWGEQDFAQSGEQAFKKQLYQCLLGQALELKSDLEVRRSTNEWGTVIWQLGEIWPTGSWGTVEYGTPVNGQVIGGRWKPIHHWLSSFLFQSVFFSCSSDETPRCILRNDNPFPISGRYAVTILRFSDGKRTMLTSNAFDLESGAARSTWTCAGVENNTCLSWNRILEIGSCASPGDCMLLTEVTTKETNVRSFIPLTAPQQMRLPNAKISWRVLDDGKIELRSDATAVFVTLTTMAQGRFGENAFVMLPGTKIVDFIWFSKPDHSLLNSTLRIEHAKMYL